MAKKPTRGKQSKGGKKPQSGKRAAKGPTMAVSDAKVLAELAFAVGQGADEAIRDDARGRPFVFDPAARDFWLDGHVQSVPKALLKNKWELVREVVTRIASRMGGLAVKFAIADSDGDVVVITVTHVTRARDQVQKTEVRCRAARGAGEGMFCAF